MWGFSRLSVDWYQQANCFSDFREIQWSISLQNLSNKHDFRENRLSLTLRVVVNERLPVLFTFLYQLRHRRCPRTVI
jgi:hypothetical protein